MKLLIAGGTGQVGTWLTAHYRSANHQVIVLCRSKSTDPHTLFWNGCTLGEWAEELNGCDAIINLAGRSVNCRYTRRNLQDMMDSRTNSTRVIGQAISHCQQPPRLWLQMSTATIYAHTFGSPNNEANGIIGGQEPDVPDYWKYSVDIAQAWERALQEIDTPHTRRIALRSAMVMTPSRGGIFDTLLRLTRWGLGGSIAGGRQYVSWIHGTDFVRALDYLILHPQFSGPVNIVAPHPLPQQELMKELRRAWGIHLGLPTTKWMSEIGAYFLRTDTELILKSRRVFPGRLLEAGFDFYYPNWSQAADDLISRYRSMRNHYSPGEKQNAGHNATRFDSL
ncbi:MAG: Epimerase family protein [Phycisphaerae bacterium]|nr:Epimerase family protein [Phycisphaerae bacterium]